MAFTPHSRVYLCGTPLDNTYKNQLYFANTDDQYNYFFTTAKHVFDDVTYQRKDNSMRVNKNIESLWNVNYVMYRNDNFNTKWFYAFITKMNYVSENVTEIFIETDVYQTWLSETVLKKSFVVREHVSNDAIGANLVDEGLETGEYIMTGYVPSGKMGDNWNIIAVSDTSPLANSDKVGNIYANIVSGLAYYPFPNTEGGASWLKTFIELYTTAGKADAIVMIFTVPELVISNVVNGASWDFGQPIPSSTPPNVDVIAVGKNYGAIDGYTPKNNKLYVYPYNFLYVTNSAGLSATFRLEDFSTETMGFALFGSITPNPKIMLAPQDYRGSGLKYEYGLTLEGFPMASWTTDAYNAWLAQNGASSAVTMLGSVGALAGGVFTANPIAIGGGALAIGAQMSQIYQASIQPDQAKGQINGGSLMYSSWLLDFYFAPMTIKSQFAKRIDDYFTMFGYKVNALKVPNVHSRTYWNYVQTIDVNIDGSIPDDDMRKLKEMYNNGVTFWHSPSHFLDYSLSNSII